MENVILTPKEQTRLQVLNSLLAEHMTLDQAVTLMGVSERHTRRILAAYRGQALPPLLTATAAAGRPTRRPTPLQLLWLIWLAQVRRGQPHPSQRAAERTRGHRNRQVYPAAYPGQRRSEQSSTKASAQTPGAPPAHAP